MPRIGDISQHKGILATVVDKGDVPRIHRPDGYKFSTASVLENIGILSTSLDTERADVSDTKINTSLSDVSTITGGAGSETGPYMEQCHPETKQVRGTINHIEGERVPRDALYPTMRVLSDSKRQPTNNEWTMKGAVINKTIPRGEYNAMKRCCNVTIKEIDHKRIT